MPPKSFFSIILMSLIMSVVLIGAFYVLRLSLYIYETKSRHYQLTPLDMPTLGLHAERGGF